MNRVISSCIPQASYPRIPRYLVTKSEAVVDDELYKDIASAHVQTDSTAATDECVTAITGYYKLRSELLTSLTAGLASHTDTVIISVMILQYYLGTRPFGIIHTIQRSLFWYCFLYSKLLTFEAICEESYVFLNLLITFQCLRCQ